MRYRIAILALLASLGSPSIAFSAEGVVGATCYAQPICPDCNERGNVCWTVQKFYPGITMIVAKKAIIKQCQKANALDECGNHCGLRQREHYKKYGGCYNQCVEVAYCIYGDNR